MAGTVVADTLQAASTSTLVLKNGVANTPPTIQDSAGTQIGTFCRAWVNFNGTLVTNPASMTGVRASFNVSSILDNSAGDYTINFTTALPDANYCPVTQSVGESTTSLRGGSMIVGTWAGGATLKTTTQLRIYTGYTFTTGGAIDSAEVNVAIFR
jgi:hypothetical protein